MRRKNKTAWVVIILQVSRLLCQQIPNRAFRCTATTPVWQRTVAPPVLHILVAWWFSAVNKEEGLGHTKKLRPQEQTRDKPTPKLENVWKTVKKRESGGQPTKFWWIITTGPTMILVILNYIFFFLKSRRMKKMSGICDVYVMEFCSFLGLYQHTFTTMC